jgi:hypothetical protein
MKALWRVGIDALAAAAVAGLIMTPALAQSKAAGGDGAAELRTAATHAGFAAKYETLKEVMLHLHHTVNCLVGPKDRMFDAAAGDPCQGQGVGALPDIKARSGEGPQYYEVQWVARMADEALQANELNQAKAAAHIAVLALQDAEKVK